MDPLTSGGGALSLVVDEESEKESLMHSFTSRQKPLNVYGTVSASSSSYSLNPTRRINRDKLITHVVQSSDTFQGLALKYGTSIEQIKRVNKLWSSDNLTLRSRPTLFIPVELANASSSGLAGQFDESTNNTISELYDASADRAIHSSLHNGADKSNGRQQPSSHLPLYKEDSLDSIDISFEDDSGLDSNGQMRTRSTLSSGQEKLNKIHNGSIDPITKSQRHLLNAGSHSISVDHQSQDAMTRVGSGDESLSDFLMRIDSHIANTRDKVETLQREDRLKDTFPESSFEEHAISRLGDTFRFSNHDHSLFTPYQAGLSRNNSRHSASSAGTAASTSGLMRPVTNGSASSVTVSENSLTDLCANGDTNGNGGGGGSVTRGRKIRSSLRRLEQRQEELFEL